MRSLLTLTALLLATPALADPQVISQVWGLAVSGPFESVPPAPAQQDEGEACTHRFIEAPETPAGRATRAAGWNVTSETPFGAYTAVGFVASSAIFASGACELYDGQIGLFAGEKLIALVYSLEKSMPVIGYAAPFGEGGVRVFSGRVIPVPVADLRQIGTDGIAVTPPALEEPVCGGKASLPYLYGLPITLARGLLIEEGWHPVPGDLYPWAPMYDLIAATGLPEVQLCESTVFQFGYCTFSYSGPVGILSLTTEGAIFAGDQMLGYTSYGVTNYGVDCVAQ
jgi:hypothetical protein